MARKYTTPEMEDLLRGKYQAPQYAFWTQIPNGTSVNKSRTCDAMAIGCWQTVKIELTGFEIKVSRSDWLKELQDVHKAEAFSVYCNRWYIVAPVGVVKLEELPPSWGLMCPTSSGNLRIKSAAAMNASPKPVPMTMLAGMMRSAVNSNRAIQEQDRALKAAFQQGKEFGIASAKDTVQRQRTIDDRCYDALKRDVEEFEATSGVKITGYSRGSIAEAVQVVMRLQGITTTHLQARLQKLLDAAAALDELKANPVAALSVPQDGSGSDIS